MKLLRRRCLKSVASTSTGDNSGVVFADSSVAFMAASLLRLIRRVVVFVAGGCGQLPLGLVGLGRFHQIGRRVCRKMLMVGLVGLEG